ncbi:MAG: glycosyltransferase family 4 protein [Paraclostridium dentum]|uniref:glycosyltransferase family 4 protein n=1 Tax=Paraclostridium dentum TaxID=2662455 RepID=UPI003EE60E4A
MKVLYLGDFIKKNGPSMVDINLTNKIKNGLLKVQINKDFKNSIRQILACDIVNISGVSVKGAVYSFLAKLFGKKVTYIMHGGLKIEKNYSNISKQGIVCEKIIIMFSDKVICVSEKFEKIIKGTYNLKKTIYINNGIELKLNNICNKKFIDENCILTVGGGRKEKGILNICKAIESLNKKDLKLIVVGEDGIDTEKIKSYDFVDYKGFIDNSDLIKLMEKSNIFIQNSLFESFGIAPLEAIASGCKVILSENIGAPIKGIESFTVKCGDTEYLAILIKKLLDNRDIQKIDKSFLENLTWENTAERYMKLWESMI